MALHFARLMALIANIVRDPKKSAYTPQDFLLNFLADPDEPTPNMADQHYALLEHVTHMTGGKVFSGDTSDEEIDAWLMARHELEHDTSDVDNQDDGDDYTHDL